MADALAAVLFRPRRAVALSLLRAAALALAAALCANALASNRQALVIGNAAYTDSPLRNPVNDARAISAALTRLGFEVSTVTDADRRSMERAMVAFSESLDADSTALFYYAGHGVQSRGRNYLLPIDARLDSETALRFEAVDIGALIEEIALKRSKVNFVVLDACRNNPFERRVRGSGKGLAAIDAAQGTLIAYATSPGSVAVDGEGDNGLYTSELLRALERPGLKAEDVFKQVRIAVAKRSGGLQVPWESSSLTGDFVFNQRGAPPVAQMPASTAPPDASLELALWNSVRDSGSAADYEEYLRRFPEGTFAGLARRRIGEGSARGSAPPACASVEGRWRHSVPSTNCESTLSFSARADGAFDMQEDGCGNTSGTARLRGRWLIIDWEMMLCKGRTELELDPTCDRGSGELVMPANFLLCAGRHAATIRRLPDGEASAK